MKSSTMENNTTAAVKDWDLDGGTNVFFPSLSSTPGLQFILKNRNSQEKKESVFDNKYQHATPKKPMNSQLKTITSSVTDSKNVKPEQKMCVENDSQSKTELKPAKRKHIEAELQTQKDFKSIKKPCGTKNRSKPVETRSKKSISSFSEKQGQSLIQDEPIKSDKRRSASITIDSVVSKISPKKVTDYFVPDKSIKSVRKRSSIGNITDKSVPVNTHTKTNDNSSNQDILAKFKRKRSTSRETDLDICKPLNTSGPKKIKPLNRRSIKIDMEKFVSSTADLNILKSTRTYAKTLKTLPLVCSNSDYSINNSLECYSDEDENAKLKNIHELNSVKTGTKSPSKDMLSTTNEISHLEPSLFDDVGLFSDFFDSFSEHSNERESLNSTTKSQAPEECNRSYQLTRKKMKKSIEKKELLDSYSEQESSKSNKLINVVVNKNSGNPVNIDASKSCVETNLPVKRGKKSNSKANSVNSKKVVSVKNRQKRKQDSVVTPVAKKVGQKSSLNDFNASVQNGLVISNHKKIMIQPKKQFCAFETIQQQREKGYNVGKDVSYGALLHSKRKKLVKKKKSIKSSSNIINVSNEVAVPFIGTKNKRQTNSNLHKKREMIRPKKKLCALETIRQQMPNQYAFDKEVSRAALSPLEPQTCVKSFDSEDQRIIPDTCINGRNVVELDASNTHISSTDTFRNKPFDICMADQTDQKNSNTYSKVTDNENLKLSSNTIKQSTIEHILQKCKEEATVNVCLNTELSPSHTVSDCNDLNIHNATLVAETKDFITKVVNFVQKNPQELLSSFALISTLRTFQERVQRLIPIPKDSVSLNSPSKVELQNSLLNSRSDLESEFDVQNKSKVEQSNSSLDSKSELDLNDGKINNHSAFIDSDQIKGIQKMCRNQMFRSFVENFDSFENKFLVKHFCECPSFKVDWDKLATYQKSPVPVCSKVILYEFPSNLQDHSLFSIVKGYINFFVSKLCLSDSKKIESHIVLKFANENMSSLESFIVTLFFGKDELLHPKQFLFRLSNVAMLTIYKKYEEMKKM